MTYTFPMVQPFPAATIRRELDRLIEDTFPARPAAWQPPVTAREDATGFTLEIDVPGIDPDGVEVLTEDGVLTVKGARAVRETGEGEKVLFSEQAHGSFGRRFRLPKSADLQGVSASYTHGVLTVRVGKVAPAQPRRVPVAVHGPAGPSN